MLFLLSKILGPAPAEDPNSRESRIAARDKENLQAYREITAYWNAYTLERKKALGLATYPDIYDDSHTPITKSANDETTRHQSDEYQGK